MHDYNLEADPCCGNSAKLGCQAETLWEVLNLQELHRKRTKIPRRLGFSYLYTTVPKTAATGENLLVFYAALRPTGGLDPGNHKLETEYLNTL